MTSQCRSRRLSLGVSLRHAARLLGTQHSNLTRYEQGTLAPGRIMGARLKAFEGLQSATAYIEGPFGTIPSYAVSMKTVSDQDVLLRILIQMVDDFRHLHDDSDRQFFLQEPSTTGDARYDALLAGLAVYAAREARMSSCPTWVFAPSRYLEQFWWFGLAGDIPQLRAHAFQHAPSCLKARGVILSARNFESV